MRILIAGGGTGGHVFPAIAIADAIRQYHSDADILFVGAEGKMEMERVPRAGYRIVGLPVSGFHRSLTWRNIRRNLLFPIKLLRSNAKAKKIVRDFKPNVVVGVGGYASGPVMRVAMKKGIPGVVQEQNSYAGVTNKILSRLAKKVCVAYDEMDTYFPKEKIVWTGNPVRQDIQRIGDKRQEGIEHFGLHSRRQTIVLLGGSLGAKTLNNAIRANADFFKENPYVQLLWQCGKLYIDEFENCETAQLPNVEIRAFLDRMDLAYAVADVCIARAGALTVSELCLAGKASVLVPSPNVAEDHQTKNASALVKKEAARLVTDTDAQKMMLLSAKEIIENNSLRNQLEKNIKTLAKPNAANEIAEIVINLAKS